MARKDKASKDKPEWLSTYGILTAERILERFNIQISHDELIETLKDPNSQYYHLLSMPLKNIFNGILINQVYDYQVYAQKLFIDYRLSLAEPVADEDGEVAASTNAEAELDLKQADLISLGEAFEERKQDHRQLISDSQAWLIQEASQQEDLGNSVEMAAFSERAEDLMFEFQSFRTEFRTLIIDVTELLNLVSDYYVDEEKMAENQEGLDFNPNLSDSTVSGDYGVPPEE
ncbi:MAG: hypothetical protein K0U37_03315 [Gammaproteobacteria bacterium]|nr:hypothetical protein [Gammaproteobacteria bacterium]